MKRKEKTEIKTKNNINWDLTFFWVRTDKNTNPVIVLLATKHTINWKPSHCYLFTYFLISSSLSSWTLSYLKLTQAEDPKPLSLSLSQINVSLRSVVLSLRSVGLCPKSVGALDQWVVFVSNRWDFLYFISLSLNSEVEISVEIGGGTLQWWVCGLWFLLIWVFTLFKSGLVKRA